MMEELANAGPDTLDGEIQHQLGRVLTKFDLDRGAISELLPPGATPRVTHAWAREGFRPISLEVNPPTELPWLVRQVLRGPTERT